MADITYSKPTWVNGSTVPISAANLQAISDAVDALADRAWISPTATGGEDGNGGQPPAPKPNNSNNTSGFWNWEASATTANSQTNGTYAVLVFNGSGAILGAGVFAQGANLASTWATCTSHTFWRLTV